MKELTIILLLGLFVAGCSTGAFTYTVEKAEGGKDEIVVDGSTVHAFHSFEKPTPCHTVEYLVEKTGSVINVFPKAGPEFEGACIQVIATERVDIKMTLEKGSYTINFYDYWTANSKGEKKPILTKTFNVG